MNYLRISKMLMAGLMALPMVSCSDDDAPVNNKCSHHQNCIQEDSLLLTKV